MGSGPRELSETAAPEDAAAKRTPSEPEGEADHQRSDDYADKDRQLQERVEEWFVAKGVPLFVGSHRSHRLIPFAFPLLAMTFAFELAVLPWLTLDELRPDLGLLINVAAVAATLALLFPTLSVFTALERSRPAPPTSTRRLRRASRAGRAGLGVLARLAPLGVVAVWLLWRGLVPEVGWQGMVDMAVLFGVLSAIRMQRLARTGGATWGDIALAGGVLALAVGFAVVDPAADRPEQVFPRRLLMGIATTLVLVHAYVRLRHRRSAPRFTCA